MEKRNVSRLKTALAVVLCLVMVVLFSAWNEPQRSQCTQVFPFGEGNPWRAENTSADELTLLLWKIDLDPRLELASVFAEFPGCFVVAWKAAP